MSKTILVIDDEPGYRELLTIVLSMQSYKVLTAEGGPEAVEILKREQVDLVITDMKMPKMDGLDILIAGRRLHPDIPFIVMTGYAAETRVKEALSQKASVCLRKPFDIAELNAVIQAIIPDPE